MSNRGSPGGKEIIVEVFSPIRRKPYPPAGYTGIRLYAELAELIRTRQSVIVFTNVRSAAEQLGLRLQELLPDLAEANRDSSRFVRSKRAAGSGRPAEEWRTARSGLLHQSRAWDRYRRSRSRRDGRNAKRRLARHPAYRPLRPFTESSNSHGVLVATNINDLVEATVTAQSVRERALDPIHIQQKPVDVVAQHIVGHGGAGADSSWESSLLLLSRGPDPFQT